MGGWAFLRPKVGTTLIDNRLFMMAKIMMTMRVKNYDHYNHDDYDSNIINLNKTVVMKMMEADDK